MVDQNNIQYNRIAEAIEYLHANFQQQPQLEEVAEKMHMSQAHFQRLFTEWVGISPKKFLQYISINHAKKILKEENATLADTSFETGLSSTSRLHDLFINIEGMTPFEYKNGGQNLKINYSFLASPFGSIIVASTHKGICYMAFEENEKEAFAKLLSNYPNATYLKQSDNLQEAAITIFKKDWSRLSEIKLHLKGTAFQIKVWENLLKIPFGKLSTYKHIAEKIGNPLAARAVGTAIGNNPIAYLIPCHRVIQSTGVFGGYMWGATRKTAIIGWEAAIHNTDS